MTNWTWVTTTMLLALGCSAGGSDTGGTTVNPGPTTMTPGTVLPGDTTPSIVGAPTASTGGGGLIDESELEPSDECDNKIQVVYRDFSQDHPDFEMAFSGDVPRRQLIAPQLGADDKPVFASSVGCPAQMGSPMACRTDWSVSVPVITSQASFDQWYRDVATTPVVNKRYDGELELTETQQGSGIYAYSSNDFFPVPMDPSFPRTSPRQDKNFLFTTEIHLLFTYPLGARFTFRGDDDLWIFINKRLALDLGSMHGQEQATIDFDAQAADLGIAPGRVYTMDIFHAERHTNASNFSIETNIACFTPGLIF